MSPKKSDREVATSESPTAQPEAQRGLPDVAAPAYETTIVDGNTELTISEKALFQVGSATITPDGQANLQSVVPELPPTGPIQVHGYTDGIGPTEDNLDLSRRRADAVVAWFVAQGIDRARLQPTPHGEEGAADNVDDPGKRRVVVIFEAAAG